MFILLGRKTTKTTMRWIERGASYEVICAEPKLNLAKWRKFLLRPFKARIIARELEEINTTLLNKYQELERAQLVLRQQARQLKTAFDINRQIRKTLDPDCVLDSIVHAMVEDAGYAAAELAINTDLPDSVYKKRINYGKIPLAIKPLLQPLKVEKNRMGAIKVWPAATASHAEAIELLKRIVPTISLAVHDALSYQTVIEYRNNLEQKVEQRTAELEKTRDDLARTVKLLKKTQGARDHFFTNISHEFRTPLTLIEGPVKQLLDGAFKGNIKEHYRLILRNTKRLLHLVNQLLDLSRINGGSLELKPLTINIVPLLKRIVMTFASGFAHKKVTLDFRSEDESIPVCLDKDAFETIINNLLSNALKFTPEGGEVTVNVKIPNSKIPVTSHKLQVASHDFIEITITNTGSYIPAEKIDRIFDRFYQADASAAHIHEGSGIGLTLTKELVVLNRGEITVESSLDAGTTFTLVFPIAIEYTKDEIMPKDVVGAKHSREEPILKLETVDENASPLQPEEIEASRLPVSGLPSPLLLIVEDNPDVTYYLRSHLESSFRIMEAQDGKDGFETAVKRIPDLIISDVMMPVMDGFAFCRKIKSDEHTSHIPVILLTARASLDDKIESLEYGADDYLTKPFDVKELQVRIHNLIKQRAQLQLYYSKHFKFDPRFQSGASASHRFYNRVVKTINSHLSDTHYSVTQFAREIGFSPPQLTRKVGALTGMSPARFIRAQRLLWAKKMLERQRNNISQIAYDCGFNNLSYFSRCFKQQFGLLPSAFIRERN